MAVFSSGRVQDPMYVRTAPPSFLHLPTPCCPFPPVQVRASVQHFGAHTQGSETSCLCFSHDNKTLVTRGGNNHAIAN